MKKLIFVNGSNGFIGKNLVKFLESDFQIIKFTVPRNLENINSYIKQAIEPYNIDYFIHLNFVKKPKSKFENFLNLEIPILIIKYLLENKKNCKFIYSGTMNIFIKNSNDLYTKQKKIIENKISNYQNVIIVRMPFIMSNKVEGDKAKLSKFVNCLPLIGLIPYKGSKINYLDLFSVMNEIKKIMNSKNIYKNYNLISNKYIYLYEIAKSLNNKKLYLYIPITIIFKYFIRNVSPAIKGIDYKKELSIHVLDNTNSKNIYFN